MLSPDQPDFHLDTSKTEWDLSPLLSGLDDPAAELEILEVEAAHQAFADKWRDQTDYLTNPIILRSALDDYEALQGKYKVLPEYGWYGNAGYYYWLRRQQDTADAEVNTKYQQAADLAIKIYNITRFFELSLAKINREDQKIFLNDPRLKEYRYFLELAFAVSRYRLSSAEEKILSKSRVTSHDNWVQLREKFVSKQKRATTLPDGSSKLQSFDQLRALSRHSNKKIRDEAAEKFNEILIESRSIAEAELNAVLLNHKNNNELRGYDRPDAYQHIKDGIDSSIIDTMMEAVSSRHDISHRFYRLKATLLEFPFLAYHERDISYGKLDQVYSWERSCQLVNEIYTEIDPEFGHYFRKFLTAGKFDVYPSVGKTTGAVSFYFTKSHPAFIKLNYTNTLQDVVTLTHEVGHGLNYEFMRRTQNSLNFSLLKSTSEVASTYLENFTYKYLASQDDDETRLVVNINRLGKLINSALRQASCYRFEQALHKNFSNQGYLSADTIGELFQKEMAAYMGPAVQQSAGSENWWIHWWHIREFFINYSYTLASLVSTAMWQKTEQDQNFIGKFKDFLSAGASACPQELFARLGIDITKSTLWHDSLNEIDQMLTDAEKLAIRLGKLPAK